jgi:signal transduction histidine kinase
MRQLSAGLALPELANASIEQVLTRAAQQHEQHTGTPVDLTLARGLDVQAPDALSNCLYRFVQEGLTNAFRHAGARGQKVSASVRNGTLLVAVSDKGPGFLADTLKGEGKLGLWGLRSRIESVGGQLEISSKIGMGTCLSASFKLNVNEVAYE